MTTGKKLAISAVMGIFGAAAALGSVQIAKAAQNSSTNESVSADKYGCGKMDGGKCGSMMTKSTSALDRAAKTSE